MKPAGMTTVVAGATDGRATAMRMLVRGVLLFATVAFAQSVPAAGKAPDSKPTVVLQRVPVPDTDREMGMGLAEFPPDAVKPRHAATGPELCYVLEGEVVVQVDGKPPAAYHAGETFRLPAGVAHVTRAGPAGAKVVAAWVRVPGQPFNVPARR
ncbi:MULTISPECIES: cupin domain-containing protein [Burkholderia]|jgi:quercetin dioxygenase-like cupin family protein|uniref:cupin domain-containing protein n=1 Tax=Burkholderia TaxID=32008 RepID=UPI001FC8B421|nr:MULTISPECIES: cupin domain-containing protein [Burkholderia]